MNDPDYVYAYPKGADNVNAKLTEKDVRVIIQLIQDDIPQRLIAKRFNTTQQAISSIATGRTWSEVTGVEKPSAEDTWKRLTRK
jgi:hypothetical protein